MRIRGLPLFLCSMLAAAALLLAAGCTPDTARWSTTEAPKENKIEFVTLSHEVKFGSNSPTPLAGEDRRLAEFLSRIAVGYGDQVTVDAGPPHGDDKADQLALKRVNAASMLLRRFQVAASAASRPSVAGALATDAVIVTIGRYVITSPNCPDWSKPESDDYTNTPPSNYGCATTTNLGLMVANPGDLVHGAPLAPGDADFAARGIQRYRSGEISKSIKPELPKLYSGGGAQ